MKWTFLDPVRNAAVGVEVLGRPHVEGSAREGGVMVGVVVPRAVQVVGHDVDEIESGRDASDVVAVVDAEDGRRHGGRQLPAGPCERRRQLLDQRREIALVRPITVSVRRPCFFFFLHICIFTYLHIYIFA